MKIGIISDIHVDISNKEDEKIEEILSDYLKEKEVEVLIIAGDISENYNTTIEVLRKIEELSKSKVLFVPGNHDLWNIKNKELETYNIYEKLKTFEGNLCDNPYELNEEYVVIGDVLWYDYSFADNSFSDEQLEMKMYMGRTWKDSHYIKWGKLDKIKNIEFIEKLKEQISKYKNKKIILVTHMITHPAFKVEYNDLWKYFNGFLGTDKLLPIIEDNNNIKYIIMGHVHYRREFKDGEKNYICRCLNYRNEWESEDIKKEIKNTLKILDL